MITHEGVEELPVESRRDNSQQLDDVLVCRREPAKSAQYGIHHGERHAGADRRGDQLADEVGIAVAQGEDLVNVQRAVGDEFAYGGLGKALRA
jgi:hypothetical protein